MIKTLLFTGGEIHDWKSCGDAIEAVLRGSRKFDVDRVNEDLDCLTPARIAPYELVVFYYTIGSITDAQKNGLLNHIAAGKGFVPIHSGADSFRDCQEYKALVGGHFVTHPAYRQYHVSIVANPADPSTLPITEGITEFMATDEQYVTDYDPRVNVIATGLYQGRALPVAWTKSWGQGRVFYLALGHDGVACQNENFKVLLERGARWAAGQLAG
jgi:uncharacterized protein